MTNISSSLSILDYVHCAKCIEQLPGGVSPQEFSRLGVGFSEIGLQVWCVRHHCNVMHIDFKGHRLPANTSTPKDSPESDGQRYKR